MPEATPAASAFMRRRALHALKSRLEELRPGGLLRGGETKTRGLLRLLVPAALNEVRAEEARDRPAALGFTLALAAARARETGGAVAFLAPEVWAGREGAPHPAALSAYGINIERFFAVFASDAKSLLWAAEETARSPAVAAAIVDFPGAAKALDLTASRRLHLAAQSAGAALILLRTLPAPEPTAAARRWRVRPAPSAADPDDDKAPGPARWRIDLERCRAGARGSFIAEHRADGAEPFLFEDPPLPRAAHAVIFDGPAAARRAV